MRDKNNIARPTSRFKTAVLSEQAYLDLAHRLMKDRKYRKRQSVLEEAVQKYPKNGRLWYKLGDRYKILRLDGRALDCFENAAFLHPDNNLYVCTYAAFLAQKNYIKQAQEIFATLDLDTAKPIDLCAVGHFFQTHKGRNDLALGCFGMALIVDPDDMITNRRYNEVRHLAGRPFEDQDWKAVNKFFAPFKNSADLEFTAFSKIERS